MTYESGKIKGSYYWYIVLTLLISTAVFKDGSIMPDYHVYKSNYQSIINGSLDRIIEPYYILISRSVSFLGDKGFFLILLFHIWITLRLIRPLLSYNTKLTPYTIVLYLSNFYILFGLIQIRAGVALSIFYYGIYYYSKKRIKFLFTVLFATLFHYSAVIFLPLVYMDKLKINRGIIFLLIVLGLLINSPIVELANYLTGVLPISDIQAKVITYTLESRAQQFKINLLSPFIISKILLGIILLTSQNEKLRNSVFINKMYYLYFFGLLSYIYLSPFPEIAVRISNYFFFSEIFLIPALIEVYKPKKIVKISIILFAIFSLIMNIKFTTYFNYQIPI